MPRGLKTIDRIHKAIVAAPGPVSAAQVAEVTEVALSTAKHACAALLTAKKIHVYARVKRGMCWVYTYLDGEQKDGGELPVNSIAQLSGPINLAVMQKTAADHQTFRRAA